MFMENTNKFQNITVLATKNLSGIRYSVCLVLSYSKLNTCFIQEEEEKLIRQKFVTQCNYEEGK